MSRELLLLRHAKSAWDTGAATDFERPLAPRGLRGAPKTGRYLAGEGLVPDYVISSPAERARQTAVLAGRELGFGEGDIVWERRIYHAGTGALVEVLQECPDAARRVMMVGHNPGFEMLLEWLCDEVPWPRDGKLMPTCAVAVLEIPCAWDAVSPGCARLGQLTRVRSLS